MLPCFKISCCAPLRVFWTALRPLGSECGKRHHNGLKEISCNFNHVLGVRRVQNRCYHHPFLCLNGFLFYSIAIKQPSLLQSHFPWLTTPRSLQHIPFALLDLSGKPEVGLNSSIHRLPLLFSPAPHFSSPRTTHCRLRTSLPRPLSVPLPSLSATFHSAVLFVLLLSLYRFDPPEITSRFIFIIVLSELYCNLFRWSEYRSMSVSPQCLCLFPVSQITRFPMLLVL